MLAIGGDAPKGASCAATQGCLFLAGAAAGCHKSFEKDKGLAVADRNVDRFAAAVKQNEGDYVGKVEEAQTVRASPGLAYR